MRLAPNHALPGPDVTCMDAAEMLVDGFIRDIGIFPDPADRNELVRRFGTLMSMQREALKGEYAELRDSSKRLIEQLGKAYERNPEAYTEFANEIAPKGFGELIGEVQAALAKAEGY